MEQKNPLFSELSDVSIRGDGKYADLTLVTQRNSKLAFGIAPDQLHSLIEDLIGLAYELAKRRSPDPVALSPANRPTTMSNIPLSQIGIATTTDAVTPIRLIARIHDFDLTFAASSSTVEQFASTAPLVLKALAADEKKRH